MGAHATPAMVVGPAAMRASSNGTSIRDEEMTGASLAQPRVIQYPSNSSQPMSSIDESHLVAET